MTIFKDEQEKEINIKPRIIVFEGVDGTGKSTSIKLASKFLAKLDIQHIVTQELSGSQTQMRFRQMLMESESAIDELLVMSLARRWHYKRVLLPALQKGKHVLLDRFVSSTWAYQGQYIKSDLMKIFQEQIWEVSPADLTIYLSGESLRQKKRDRFEQKEEDFFKKAREIYQNRAALAVRQIKASELRFEKEDGFAVDLEDMYKTNEINSLDCSIDEKKNNQKAIDKNLRRKKAEDTFRADTIAASYISVSTGSWLSVKAGQQWAVNRAILSLINSKE